MLEGSLRRQMKTTQMYKINVNLLSDSMGKGLWPGFPTLAHFNIKLFIFSMSLGVRYPDGGAVFLPT